eukprot:COSAG01_NODE_2683_length_7256_cov_28.923432_7_plen_38_part_00
MHVTTILQLYLDPYSLWVKAMDMADTLTYDLGLKKPA